LAGNARSAACVPVRSKPALDKVFGKMRRADLQVRDIRFQVPAVQTIDLQHHMIIEQIVDVHDSSHDNTLFCRRSTTLRHPHLPDPLGGPRRSLTGRLLSKSLLRTGLKFPVDGTVGHAAGLAWFDGDGFRTSSGPRCHGSN
jgi:hypothetical protein